MGIDRKSHAGGVGDAGDAVRRFYVWPRPGYSVAAVHALGALSFSLAALPDALQASLALVARYYLRHAGRSVPARGAWGRCAADFRSLCRSVVGDRGERPSQPGPTRRLGHTGGAVVGRGEPHADRCSLVSHAQRLGNILRAVTSDR